MATPKKQLRSTAVDSDEGRFRVALPAEASGWIYDIRGGKAKKTVLRTSRGWGRLYTTPGRHERPLDASAGPVARALACRHLIGLEGQQRVDQFRLLRGIA